MSDLNETREDSPSRREEDVPESEGSSEDTSEDSSESDFYDTPLIKDFDAVRRNLSVAEAVIESDTPGTSDLTARGKINSGNDAQTDETDCKETDVQVSDAGNISESVPGNSQCCLEGDENRKEVDSREAVREVSSSIVIGEESSKEVKLTSEGEEENVTDSSDILGAVSSGIQQNHNKIDLQVQCSINEDVDTKGTQCQVEVNSVAVQCKPKKVSRSTQLGRHKISVAVQCELLSFTSSSAQCNIINSVLTETDYQDEAEVEVHQSSSSVEIIEGESDTDEHVGNEKRKLPENVRNEFVKPTTPKQRISSTVFQRQPVCKILFPRLVPQVPPRTLHQKTSSTKKPSPAKSDSNLYRRNKEKNSPAKSLSIRPSETVQNSSRHYGKISPHKHSSRQKQITEKNLSENCKEIPRAEKSPQRENDLPVKRFYGRVNLADQTLPPRQSVKSYFTGVPKKYIDKTSRQTTSERKELSEKNRYANRDKVSVSELAQPNVQEWMNSLLCERHSTPDSISDENGENEKDSFPQKTNKMFHSSSLALQQRMRRHSSSKSTGSRTVDVVGDDQDVVRSSSREMKERSGSRPKDRAFLDVTDIDHDKNVQCSSRENSRKAPSRKKIMNVRSSDDDDDDNNSFSESLSHPCAAQKQLLKKNQLAKSPIRRHNTRNEGQHVASPSTSKRSALYNFDEDNLSDIARSSYSRKGAMQGAGTAQKSQLREGSVRDDEERAQKSLSKRDTIENSRKNKNLLMRNAVRNEKEYELSPSIGNRILDGRNTNRLRDDKVQSEEESEGEEGQGLLHSTKSSMQNPRPAKQVDPRERASEVEKILPVRRKKRKLYSGSATLPSVSLSESEDIIPETPPVLSPKNFPANENSSSSSHESELGVEAGPSTKKKRISPEPRTLHGRLSKSKSRQLSSSSLSSIQEEDQGDEERNNSTKLNSSATSVCERDSQIAKRKIPTAWSSDSESEKSSRNINKPLRKLPYTRAEREAIIDYIVAKKLFSQVGGRHMWEVMEKRRVCENRTWQSMKEHFRKQILPSIESYSLPKEVLRRFLSIKKKG